MSYIPSFPSGIKRGPPARRHRETCCSVASGVSDSLRPPWTGAHQAPLSVGFPRQEYWSGLPFPSPGGLPDPGIEPTSPALQAGSLPHLNVNPRQRQSLKKMQEANLASCLYPTSCLPLFSYTFLSPFPCPFPTLSLIPFLFSRFLIPTWWLQLHQPDLNLLLCA